MPGDYDAPAGPGRRNPQVSGSVSIIGGIVLLSLLAAATFWYVIRVEVDAGEILVLVNKSGTKVPADLQVEYADQVILYPELVEAIAAKTGQAGKVVLEGFKGIQLRVRGEGRYFPNPYTYKAIKLKATSIAQNEIGVLVRKFGRPLPFPKTVATEPDERGPVDKILPPGRHNINLLAYDVLRFPATQVPEGHVGVVTLLSGHDPKTKNTYTVEPEEKGVQAESLPPGLYYVNPFLKRIEVVDVRSHKYDMLGESAIQFPSSDSFTISIEGTIEWALRPDHVADVTVAYGDEEDILQKIILPNARSISRIQGSKLKAREFISGRTRTAFQEALLRELKRDCWTQGVDIKAALVRDIQPPAEIARLISQREQADQEIERSTNEMEEAKAEALLVEQKELQQQNMAIGDARRQVVTMTKEAEQNKGVAVTKASRELEVAKLNVESAEKQAAAIRSRGEAEANVILFEYQAKAEPLARSVKAFGNGTTYAQQFFLQRVAPSIQSILSNTDGPFAEIFKELQEFRATSPQGGEQ